MKIVCSEPFLSSFCNTTSFPTVPSHSTFCDTTRNQAHENPAQKVYDLTREADLENPAIHQKAQELISQLEALLVTKSTKVPDNGVDD